MFTPARARFIPADWASTAKLANLANWLPSQCEVCRRWNPERLCADCRARHAAPCPRCVRCGLRTGLVVAACGECLRDSPPFHRTHCAVDYAFPWAQLLQAFKFEGHEDLARPLAQMLAQAVRQDRDVLGDRTAEAGTAGGPAALPDLLLPVPLSSERLRQRGYNQAWELARRLGPMLQLPARADLLQRSQHGAAQSGLSREQRQRNLGRTFQVPAAATAVLAGRHVALVDDVMTTGATARAAAAVLIGAGVASVEVWVLARTPSPSLSPSPSPPLSSAPGA